MPESSRTVYESIPVCRTTAAPPSAASLTQYSLIAPSPPPESALAGVSLLRVCAIHELPDIDFVAVSHNHFDHCDLDAARVSTRSKPSLTNPVDDDRGIPDQNWSLQLWCSWAVHQIPEDDGAATVSVYYAGDTGYQTAGGACPVFKEIGTKLSPFNLAMCPPSASSTTPSTFSPSSRCPAAPRSPRRLLPTDDTHLVTLHATPEDAVRLAADVRAALAMHFGTFAGRTRRSSLHCGSEVEGLDAVAGSSSSTMESGPGSGSGSERMRVGIEVIDVGECVTFEVGGVPVATVLQ
ncbi:hypothetical protein GGX14DRAFT_620009 [Mycena pura]|uniref:Metallo-beta-lactamase domain-containing protein n=1 Tax=Mycena pura TaxID=153505 RepID=A0AAD6VKY1_9AGAR|nr:hypothetical protein GGX14DRAFT_620009 [Mycena pura]